MVSVGTRVLTEEPRSGSAFQTGGGGTRNRVYRGMRVGCVDLSASRRGSGVVREFQLTGVVRRRSEKEGGEVFCALILQLNALQ